MKILINVADGAVDSVVTDDEALAIVKTADGMVKFNTTVDPDMVTEMERDAVFTSDDL